MISSRYFKHLILEQWTENGLVEHPEMILVPFKWKMALGMPFTLNF
jgi:hypothetical protein